MSAPGGAEPGPDGLLRCPWALGTADYRAYHDQEWGQPVRSDAGIFERLSLEAFQSGLSWLTILRKRENFRAAFGGFDPETVAGFGPADEARLPPWMCPAGSPRLCGGTRARSRRLLSPWLMCPPRRLPPWRARASCGNWGSPSWGLSRSMPPCRPVVWWTTTSPDVSAVAPARKSRPCD